MNPKILAAISVLFMLLAAVIGFTAGRSSLRPLLVRQDLLIEQLATELRHAKDPRIRRIAERTVRRELVNREASLLLGLSPFDDPDPDVNGLIRDGVFKGAEQ